VRVRGEIKTVRPATTLGISGMLNIRACATGRVSIAICDSTDAKRTPKDESAQYVGLFGNLFISPNHARIKLLCILRTRLTVAAKLTKKQLTQKDGIVYPIAFGILRSGPIWSAMIMWCPTGNPAACCE